jgi:biotin carboxyl carrier protein
MKKNENFGILNIDSGFYKTRLSPGFINRKLYKPPSPKMIISYIPGTVLEILVRRGQNVRKGDTLVILDAMKMQNFIKCSIDGTVKKINVSRGHKVSKGTVLIELKQAKDFPRK